LRTLLAIALAATLVGCSRQPPHQAASESCTDKRQFACLHRTTAHQPIEPASLKTRPPRETKLKSEKPPPLRGRDRAAHSITKKAKSASTTAKNEPTATRTPTPPPPLRTQLEPKSRTIQEQVAAATAVAERITGATGAPNNADHLVAIVIVRPEIKSVSDLTGKNIAIDDRYLVSGADVRIAIAAAGAPSVQLSAGNTTAIDRLVNGEVPAAVLALVSAVAAEGFPEIAGFRVFHVPLSFEGSASTQGRGIASEMGRKR